MEISKYKMAKMTFSRTHKRPERIVHALINPNTKPAGAVGRIFRIDRVVVNKDKDKDWIIFHLTEFVEMKLEADNAN